MYGKFLAVSGKLETFLAVSGTFNQALEIYKNKTLRFSALYVATVKVVPARRMPTGREVARTETA